MDQGRHVNQLDRGGRPRGSLATAGTGAEQDEQRPQALAARRQRCRNVGAEQLAVTGGLFAQQVLDLSQPGRQPATGGVEHCRDRGRYRAGPGHPAMPLWIVTIPPARTV